MRRGPNRHRLGLMLVGAGLILLFVWDSAHGQGFRPRGPNMPRPPFGGGGPGGGMGGFNSETGYRCSNCGTVMVAKSGSLLDKPSSCPKCGTRFINGGLGGTGSAANGNPATPPVGGNPAVPPTNFNPNPPAQPPVMPQQPATPPQQPAQQPAMPPQAAAPAPTSGAATSSSTSTTVAASSGSKWLIPGIIALVVLGALGVGGVWMMVASLKADSPPPRRSRGRSRRRRDDDDDD